VDGIRILIALRSGSTFDVQAKVSRSGHALVIDAPLCNLGFKIYIDNVGGID
jgi:hypothetical protein